MIGGSNIEKAQSVLDMLGASWMVAVRVEIKKKQWQKRIERAPGCSPASRNVFERVEGTTDYQFKKQLEEVSFLELSRKDHGCSFLCYATIFNCCVHMLYCKRVERFRSGSGSFGRCDHIMQSSFRST